MKATCTQQSKPFSPYTLTIILETPEELQSLYDVCTHARPIGDLIFGRSIKTSRSHIATVLKHIYVALSQTVGSIGYGSLRIWSADEQKS